MVEASRELALEKEPLKIYRAQGRYDALMKLVNFVIGLADEGIVSTAPRETIQNMEELYERYRDEEQS